MSTVPPSDYGVRLAAQLRSRFMSSSGLPDDAPLSAAFGGPLRACCPPERRGFAAADDDDAPPPAEHAPASPAPQAAQQPPAAETSVGVPARGPLAQPEVRERWLTRGGRRRAWRWVLP
jgi:hypothetical protein